MAERKPNAAPGPWWTSPLVALSAIVVVLIALVFLRTCEAPSVAPTPDDAGAQTDAAADAAEDAEDAATDEAGAAADAGLDAASDAESAHEPEATPAPSPDDAGAETEARDASAPALDAGAADLARDAAAAPRDAGTP